MKKKGCFSYVLVALISSVASLMLAGVLDTGSVTVPDLNPEPDWGLSEGEDTGDDDSGQKDKTPDTGDSVPDDNSTLVSRSPVSCTYYYDQMNREEKQIYDALLQCVQKGEKSIKLENVELITYEDYCHRAAFGLTYDHPELFWLKSGYSMSKRYNRTQGYGDITLEFMQYSYWDYSMDKTKKSQELADAVTKVANLARNKTSDYDVIQFVHDYLVENAIYDHDALNEFYKTYHNASCEYIFSAYGCLINKKTVCAGYAKAFQMIMQELGYECIYVVGDAGGSHAWNCVFLEEEGYFVDITWDDPDYTHDEPLYEYFCITNEALERTHELDDLFETPECDSDKYNYFVYNHYRMDTYSFEEAARIITAQSDQHIISVQFGSKREMKKAVEDLMSYGKIKNIPAIKKPGDIRYSQNEDHFTLTIYQ